MNEVIMLHDIKPAKILQAVLEDKIPLFISYLSQGRWHVARGLLTGSADDSFIIKISPQKRSRPVNLQIAQTVGISFKYGFDLEYDRFVFDTTVIALQCCPDSTVCGQIALAIPNEIEMVKKRSYFRVRVPKSLDVDVEMWHRSYIDGAGQVPLARTSQGWHGKLVDISAAGLQIAIDSAQGPDLETEQCVGLHFTPLPNETSLTFNAYVKSVSPTAIGNDMCFGLQIIGLETSPEGRLVLQRLCSVVDQYRQINEVAADQPDAQP